MPLLVARAERANEPAEAVDGDVAVSVAVAVAPGASVSDVGENDCVNPAGTVADNANPEAVHDDESAFRTDIV